MQDNHDHDDFPRLRAPQTQMPGKAGLKRSLIPAQEPIVLKPDLRVTFADKEGLKRIAAPAGRVVRMRWSSARASWATTAVAAAVAVMVWFASPIETPLAPPAAPAPLAAKSADARAISNAPITAQLVASTSRTLTAGTTTDLTEPRDVWMASAESSAATAAPMAFLERKFTGEIPMTFAPSNELLVPAAAEFCELADVKASGSAPAIQDRLLTAQEAIAAFVADQPIGGAIERVKNLRESLATARQEIPSQARDVRLQAQQRTNHWRDAIRKKRETIEKSVEASWKRLERQEWQNPIWPSQR